MDSLYFKKALVYFQSSRQCTGSIIWDLVVTEAAECHNNGKIMIPPQLVPYIHCGLSLRQYQLLFVCLSAMELKVFHFLISKLLQRSHPSGCCNEKCKHYIVMDHNSCHYDTVKYYYKTHGIKISWSNQISHYIITTQRIAFFDLPSLQPCRDSFIFCDTQ